MQNEYRETCNNECSDTRKLHATLSYKTRSRRLYPYNPVYIQNTLLWNFELITTLTRYYVDTKPDTKYEHISYLCVSSSAKENRFKRLNLFPINFQSQYLALLLIIFCTRFANLVTFQRSQENIRRVSFYRVVTSKRVRLIQISSQDCTPLVSWAQLLNVSRWRSEVLSR